MAVILEVVRPDGTREWRRLESHPLTIGRGFANDLILDDPYVDARHARISLEDGRLQIHDLGSVNGIVVGGTRTGTSLSVETGLEVRLGRTRLRFRDPEEPVAPALAEEQGPETSVTGPASSAKPRRGVTARWPTTPRGQLLLTALALVAFGASSWLSSFERSGVDDVASGVGGFAALAAVWAGLWAVVSRATVRRFNFLGHVAVVAAITLVGLAWSVAEDWLTFFLPDAAALEVMSTLVLVVTLCGLIAGHLAFGSTMSRTRRWRLGLIAAGSTVAVLGLGALAASDEFTDVPTFPGTLKPVREDLVPASTVEDFSAVIRQLKQDVDEMARND